MNLYNISTDEKILDKSSRQYERVKWYLDVVDNLYFLVFTTSKDYKEHVEIIDNKIFKVIPLYGENKLLQIINLFIFFKNLKKGSGDIISPQDPFEIGLISYVLAKIYKLKFCVQMHTDTSSKYFVAESLRNKIQYYISLFVFKRADSIRVVSKRMKDYLVEMLKIDQNKIHVIPVFVDVEKFRIKNEEIMQKSVDLLMLSRIECVKNIDLAIDAVYSINLKRTQTPLRQGYAGQVLNNLRLEIVGNGSDKKRLQQKYKGSEYDFVTWVDYNNNVVEEYAKAKVFLISSKYEGYAITAVEAVASGIPVVMTPVGCADEFIISGVNGEVSEGFDLDNYVKAIELSLKNLQTDKYDLNLHSNKLTTLSMQELLAKYKKFIKV